MTFSDNRTTMNLTETIKLPSMLSNQSEQQSTMKYFSQPFNETFKEDKGLYHFYKKEQLIFLVTLLILIIVGNSLVLLTLKCNKRRKPRMNYFIKHLAYSDLLVGLVSVSIDITWKITLSFNAGNILCKLVKYFQELVIYASTYILIMLSLDRYDAVINPLNFNTRTNRAKHMVFSAWFLSALLSIPALFLNQIRIKNNLPQCWIELNPYEWRLYFTLVSLSLFFIPTLIIFFCYVCIIRTIWFQRQTEQTGSVSNDRSVVKDANLHCTSKEQFLSTTEQLLLNKENQLLSETEQFLNKDQFTNETKDQFTNCIEQTSNEQLNTSKEQESNIHFIKPELAQFRDQLGLKLNSITQSSVWRPENCFTNKFNNFNDTFNNSSTIDKTDKTTTNSSNRSSLFNSRSKMLLKHHSFDQAFDPSFDRIKMNPKLNSIKEQTRPTELASSLKIDLSHHPKKNSCMRVNSQGIIPKARIKTLQMTFVIITVFICCWSPYILWDLLQVYGYIKRSAATNAISTFIQSLAPLNSAANPLIFCFFSSKEVFQTIKLIWHRLTFWATNSNRNKLEQINNRSLTNTTIRKNNKNNSSPTTTSSVCTTNTKSTTLSRSKSTEN